MTAQPRPEQFLPNGEVRTSDVLHSIAKQIDHIVDDQDTFSANAGGMSARFRVLAARVRRLAEAIEKGKP